MLWIVTLTVTIGTLVAAIALVDFQALGVAISRVPLGQICLIALALTAGALIASIRLRFIVSDVGHQLSLRESIAALSLGNATGAVVLQFFGQLAARSAYLAPRGIPLSSNITISIYERLVAFGVSASLALIGAWFLFGRVALQIEDGGAQLLNVVAGLAVAIGAGAFFAWGRLAIEAAKPFAKPRTLILIARNVGLTFGIHFCTAVAYVLAAQELVHGVSLIDISAASLVVMFAAGLPISFAGWGVRELSAVFALRFVGIPAADALAASVIVGTASLLVVVVLAVVTAVRPGELRPTS